MPFVWSPSHNTPLPLTYPGTTHMERSSLKGRRGCMPSLKGGAKWQTWPVAPSVRTWPSTTGSYSTTWTGGAQNLLKKIRMQRPSWCWSSWMRAMLLITGMIIQRSIQSIWKASTKPSHNLPACTVQRLHLQPETVYGAFLNPPRHVNIGGGDEPHQIYATRSEHQKLFNLILREFVPVGWSVKTPPTENSLNNMTQLAPCASMKPSYSPTVSNRRSHFHATFGLGWLYNSPSGVAGNEADATWNSDLRFAKSRFQAYAFSQKFIGRFTSGSLVFTPWIKKPQCAIALRLPDAIILTTRTIHAYELQRCELHKATFLSFIIIQQQTPKQFSTRIPSTINRWYIRT